MLYESLILSRVLWRCETKPAGIATGLGYRMIYVLPGSRANNNSNNNNNNTAMQQLEDWQREE